MISNLICERPLIACFSCVKKQGYFAWKFQFLYLLLFNRVIII